MDASAGLPDALDSGGGCSPGRGLLLLGTGGSRGRIGVLTMGADGLVSADEVSIVGPGMHRIDLRSHATGPLQQRSDSRHVRTTGAVVTDDRRARRRRRLATAHQPEGRPWSAPAVADLSSRARSPPPAFATSR